MNTTTTIFRAGVMQQRERLDALHPSHLCMILLEQSPVPCLLHFVAPLHLKGKRRCGCHLFSVPSAHRSLMAGQRCLSNSRSHIWQRSEKIGLSRTSIRVMFRKKRRSRTQQRNQKIRCNCHLQNMACTYLQCLTIPLLAGLVLQTSVLHQHPKKPQPQSFHLGRLIFFLLSFVFFL